MEPFRHFSVASYMFAYYADRVTDEELRRDVETYLSCLPLKKVYVENHRATTDVPVSRLREGPSHWLTARHPKPAMKTPMR